MLAALLVLDRPGCPHRFAASRSSQTDVFRALGQLLATAILLCGCSFDPSGLRAADGGDPPPLCDFSTSPDCEPAPDAGAPTPSPGRSAPPLLAHWRFDGDGRDALGRFDAAEIGDVRYVPGPLGLALDLANESDCEDDGAHVRVASDAPDGTTPGTLSPDSFSVALWMKFDGAEEHGMVFERGRPCLASYWLQLTDKTLYAGLNAGTAWCDQTILAAEVEESNWQHVTFTAERSSDYAQLQLRLYLNGTVVASRDLSGWYPNQAVSEDDHSRYLVMGRNYLYPDGSGDLALRHFRGQLDDVRLYQGALTATQVATLYASY